MAVQLRNMWSYVTLNLLFSASPNAHHDQLVWPSLQSTCVPHSRILTSDEEMSIALHWRVMGACGLHSVCLLIRLGRTHRQSLN